MSQLSWVSNLSTCSTHVISSISSISSYHLTNHAKNFTTTPTIPPNFKWFTPLENSQTSLAGKIPIVTTGNLHLQTVGIFQPFYRVAKATFKSFPVSGSLLMTFPNSKQPPDRRFFRGFQQFSNFRHQVVVDILLSWTNFERFGWTKMKTEMDFFCEIKGFHRVWPKMFQSLRSLNIYFVRFFSFSIKENKQIFVQMIMILV